MEYVFVREIVIVLFCALVGGFIALKLKQPALIGYLVAGFFFSFPFFSNLVDFDFSRSLAQIGVALLLFTTGLDFPISKLIKIRKQTIIASILQFSLFILLVMFLFPIFHLVQNAYEGLFISAAFSNSATVIVLKLMEKSKKIDRKISETIVSWLVLQDIAMVVMAIIISTFSTTGKIGTYDIFEAIARSFVFITLSILLGKSLIPKLFETVSKTNSFEILLILSFLFCMVVAYVAEIIGLSYTLGAFIAGVMISESFVNHEIISEIRPLRDLFSALFYVTLGILITPSFIFSNILKITSVVVGLMFLKFITSFVILVIFEKQTRNAFVVSMILNQGGEFVFILAQIGLNNGWIDKDFYSLNLVVSILSILLTPVIVSKSEQWYQSLREFLRKRSPGLYRILFVKFDRIIDVDQPDFENHVVICGFGRVGSYVGRALDKTDIPYMVIDSSSETVDYCKQRGIKIVFGDASNIDILEKADVERAMALVVALPEEGASEMIASNAKMLNPNIKVIARSHIPSDDQRLKVKGVTMTVEPEFEAAVSISKKILDFFGKKEMNVSKYLKKSRRRQRSKLGKK